jgi:hypothetical protein
VEFNNKNLGFNKKCAFQQQNVALNQQKIVDSTVEMLEFSHQKMADFKRRGFQATKTVHWTKTGNFGVYQHFQTNPNVIFAKNPIENNEIPLNTHGKKTPFSSTKISSTTPKSRVGHVTCGASGGSSDMCEVHNFRPPRVRPRRGFLGPEIGDVMEISCGFMAFNRDLMVIEWILMCL